MSIVVPVHNGGEMLRRCLASLHQHAPHNCEIIVVDDGSVDSSADVGLLSGFHVVRAEKKAGPAAARNLGAQVARGDVLIFLDADVCLQSDTLRELLAPLADETVSAVFGSYDAKPEGPSLVSRFRNLLHHYVHQTASTEAATFWAGCGAVRKSLFLDIGGFDPTFTNPSVEDIEFGMRLRMAGHRIVLNKQAQVTHLKRWTLFTMCTTDVWRRGVPWSRLILREGRMPNDLNLKPSQRLSVILTAAVLGLFGVAAWTQPWIIAVCLAGVLAIWLANADFYRLLSRTEGWGFAIAVFPVHLLFFLTCGLAFAIGAAAHLSSAVLSIRSRKKPVTRVLTEHEAT